MLMKCEICGKETANKVKINMTWFDVVCFWRNAERLRDYLTFKFWFICDYCISDKKSLSRQLAERVRVALEG